MKLSNFRTLIAGAAILGGLVLASQAQAGFRHHHAYGYGGYGYGSSGSSGYGSSGGSSGGYYGGSSGGYTSWGGWGSGGSSGGWGRHHHGWGSYGSYGGGYYGSSGGYYGSSGGYYGSSGGSSGGYYGGSSGGSSGGYIGGYSSGYPVIDGTPMAVPQQTAPVTPGAVTPGPAPAPSNIVPPATPTPPGPTEGSTTLRTRIDGDSVLLSVKVPADAKVFVNGHLTSSTGTDRSFVSRGLTLGGRYTYDVRAEVTVGGKTVTDTQSVQLTSGESANLAFALNGDGQLQANSPSVTKLTLHVPADARVFLAGQEAASTGEVREFTTSRLAPGATWSAYTIRAEIQRDGQTVVREATVSLAAGDSKDLTLDFNSDAVANATPVASTR